MHDGADHRTAYRPSTRRSFLLFWLSYAIFIVYVTTLPFDFDPSIALAIEKLKAVPLHVFMTADGHRASYSDMLQNVVLFAPFGALTFLVVMTRIRTSFAVCATAGIGCLLSTSVEGLQLFTADRVSSLNDVITDTAGALVGAIAMAVTAAVAGRARVRASYGRILHELYPVLVWCAVLVLATWHPFDTTVDIGSIGSKVRLFLRDPWQQGALGDEGVDAVRYAMFSVACVQWFRRLELSRPRAAAALVGTLVAAGLECSQFFVHSRMPGLKDVTVGAVASCLAALVAVPRIWNRRVAAVVLAVCSVAATGLMTLSPLAIQAERRPFQLFPFRTYQAVRPEIAISHAVELTLAFFPLGYALAFALRRRGRWWWVAGTALALGGILEYLQGWIVGRYPDVTDVAVLTLGALAGHWAATHVTAD